MDCILEQDLLKTSMIYCMLNLDLINHIMMITTIQDLFYHSQNILKVMKIKKPIIAIVLFVFSFVFSAGSIPNFKLKNLDGNRINMHSFLNEDKIILYFWSIELEQCKEQLTFLNEIQKKYLTKGIKVIAINIDDKKFKTDVKLYVKSNKFIFEVLFDNKSSLLKKLDGQTIPYLCFANEEGIVINKYDQIIETHRVAGSSDYLLKIVSPSMDEYDKFQQILINEIECTNMKTSFSQKEIKKIYSFPLDYIK